MKDRFKSILYVALMTGVPLLVGSPAKAQVGYLYVASEPSGARLTIPDLPGPDMITPVLCTLAVGRHQLLLAMDHFRPETLSVSIEAGEVTRHSVRFIKLNQMSAKPPGETAVFQEYGSLTLISDFPDAKIYLDRDSIEHRTPVTLDNVAAGPHQVTLQLGRTLYDTTVVIHPDQVTVVQASFADLADGTDSDVPTAIPVDYEIEIPGCSYRRDYDKHPEGTNIGIKGCDVTVRLATRTDTVEFSHTNLSGPSIRYDHRGYPTEKRVEDTVLTGRVSVSSDDSLTVGLRVYANPKTGWTDRDHIEPTIKSYVIPADFNFGSAINLRLRIKSDGTISFRYF